MTSRRAHTITNLHQDAKGVWRADVDGMPCDREHGSWRMYVSGERMAYDVLPHLAAELQVRVRRLERKQAA